MAYALCMQVTKNYTHTRKYVTRIAFPLQQRLLERTAMLHYTHIACLVYSETYCFVPLMERRSELTFTIEEKWFYKVWSNFLT